MVTFGIWSKLDRYCSFSRYLKKDMDILSKQYVEPAYERVRGEGMKKVLHITSIKHVLL